MSVYNSKNIFHYLAESDDEYEAYPGCDNLYRMPTIDKMYDSDNEIIDIITDSDDEYEAFPGSDVIYKMPTIDKRYNSDNEIIV